MATSNTIYNEKTPFEALYEFMRVTGVQDYWYLFERSWFAQSPDLQAMVVQAIMQGRAKTINVTAPDFREHIQSLISGNMSVDP